MEKEEVKVNSQELKGENKLCSDLLEYFEELDKKQEQNIITRKLDNRGE